MSPAATPTRSPALGRADPQMLRTAPKSPASPIVAAVDDSAASRAAVETAVRLGADLGAPVLFVYVRRGPAGFFGAPVYQRRLTKAMDRARRVLESALAVATNAGVSGEAEILEGTPPRRIAEFARNRDARLVVVGSRQRRLGPSVSSAVVRAAGRPVVVARGLQRLATPPGAAIAGFLRSREAMGS